jgi:hypothetical protein
VTCEEKDGKTEQVTTCTKTGQRDALSGHPLCSSVSDFES